MAEEFSKDLEPVEQGVGLRLGFAKQPVRAVLVHTAVVAVFGILLPWWLGVRFLSAVTLTAYCCFGVLFAAPVAAESFAVERPRSWKAAVFRIGWAAGYGEAMAIVMLIAGIVTIRFTPAGALFALDISGMGEALLLGLSATIAMASIAALIALQITSPAARGLAIRVIFLGLLILFFFDSQRLPEIVLPGIAVCAAVSALALIGLRQLLAPRDAR